MLNDYISECINIYRAKEFTWSTGQMVNTLKHHIYVILGAMASQITSLTIVHSTVYSRRRSKKTPKLRVTGLCAGKSPVTGELPAHMGSDAENVPIWWRNHGLSNTDAIVLTTFHFMFFIGCFFYFDSNFIGFAWGFYCQNVIICSCNDGRTGHKPISES